MHAWRDRCGFFLTVAVRLDRLSLIHLVCTLFSEHQLLWKLKGDVSLVFIFLKQQQNYPLKDFHGKFLEFYKELYSAFYLHSPIHINNTRQIHFTSVFLFWHSSVIWKHVCMCVCVHTHTHIPRWRAWRSMAENSALLMSTGGLHRLPVGRGTQFYSGLYPLGIIYST